MIITLSHLLKWQYQPKRRSNSWRLTIDEQRIRASQVLKANPSLKPKLGETILEAYLAAVPQAAWETTHLAKSAFPPAFEHTGWSLEQILDEEFYPES